MKAGIDPSNPGEAMTTPVQSALDRLREDAERDDKGTMIVGESAVVTLRDDLAKLIAVAEAAKELLRAHLCMKPRRGFALQCADAQGAAKNAVATLTTPDPSP